MLFSYYFDAEKTHLLNCHFQVLQFTEKAAGAIEIMFSAEIAELRNAISLKKEIKIATFTFPATPEGQSKHDIDFARVRYADEKKWIFTVINNKDNAQQAEVGLISGTANKNPLGLDIYHDDDEFNAELKTNNLSILEPTYVSPILTQTIVSAGFEQAGYPNGFNSFTGNYDAALQYFKVNDFTQDFLEPVPAQSYFKASLDIAPYELETLNDTNLFDITIPNLGHIAVRKNSLEYTLSDGLSSDTVRAFYDLALTASDVWNNSMIAKSRLTIEGDGQGSLTVSYAGKTIAGVYDPSKTFDRMEFRGGIVRTENGTAADPNGELNPYNWAGSRIDNLAVIYKK